MLCTHASDPHGDTFTAWPNGAIMVAADDPTIGAVVDLRI